MNRADPVYKFGSPSDGVGIWKPFEKSRFLVTWFGESAGNEIIDGWENVLTHIDKMAGDPDEYSVRNPCWEGHDSDAWYHADLYMELEDQRLQYSEQFGETNTLQITRIFERE